MCELVLADIIAEIDALRPSCSYDEIGERFGVNRGIVWKLHNLEGYTPAKDTLRKLGVTRYPVRTRLIAQVDADTKSRVRAACQRDGCSEAELLRSAVDDFLRARERVWLVEDAFTQDGE